MSTTLPPLEEILSKKEVTIFKLSPEEKTSLKGKTHEFRMKYESNRKNRNLLIQSISKPRLLLVDQGQLSYLTQGIRYNQTSNQIAIIPPNTTCVGVAKENSSFYILEKKST